MKKSGRKIYDFSKNKVFIFDNEKYFTLSGTHMSGNSFYYIEKNEKKIHSNSSHVKERTKFEPKVHLWIAISAKWISTPILAPSGIGIKQNVYVKNCLESRLKPFIKKFYPKDDVLFWPDTIRVLLPSFYGILR